MSEPVFFISHFAIKEGALEDLKGRTGEVMQRLREESPGRSSSSHTWTRRAAGSRSYTHFRMPTRWTSTSRARTSGPQPRTSSSNPEGGSCTDRRASR